MIEIAMQTAMPGTGTSEIPCNNDIKPIPGHEGYFADTQGNIYSTSSGKLKELQKRDNHNGYLQVDVSGEEEMVHRLVALAHIPNDKPERTEVNHINLNRKDNRVCNLEWRTPEENRQHSRTVRQARAGKITGLVAENETLEYALGHAQTVYFRVGDHLIKARLNRNEQERQ